MTVTPVAAAEPSAALASAVAVAQAHKSDRFAFTARFEDLASDNGRVIEVRFDPRRTEGERWTLLSPKESELDKDEREQLKGLRKSNGADDGLVYDKLAASLDQARLVSSDAKTAVFAAPIIDDETPKEVREAVEMRIVVDLEGGFIRSVELASQKPFKPSPVARVRSMKQLQTYLPAAADGPALLASSVTDVEGEAMFKSFERHTRVEYHDIEAVPASAVAASGAAAK